MGKSRHDWWISAGETGSDGWQHGQINLDDQSSLGMIGRFDAAAVEADGAGGDGEADAGAEGGEADTRTYRVNCDKVQRALPDFKPQWTVKRGAEELLAAYQRIGLTLDEFEGQRYRRISHIKHLISSGRLDDSLRWTQPQSASPITTL